MRVLVVEDERLLADTITAGLRNRAIAVDVAYDGDAALERLAVNDYDVIVLDRDLPVVSGDDVCRTLVESGAETRILMLTAATAVQERVAGLGPRRRRLPDQTIRVRRAHRPDPGAGAQGAARRAPRAGTRRHPARPPSPHRHPRRRAHSAVPQRVRRARRAAARRRRRGVGRAAAGEGLGRTHRPVHRCGSVHHHDGAPQARPATGHPDRPRRRIPHPMKRWWRSTIRVRLTLLYAGAFFLAGAILVAVMYFVMGQALDRQLTARVGIAEHLPQET